MNYNKSFIFLLLVLISYSAIVATSHHYVRFTADSTLYLNIAEKYIRGDFGNAINGYWGPLLSWLMIPFLYFGLSDVFIINTLNLIIGVFAITGVWILSIRFELTEALRIAILISLLPIMLFVSIIEPFDFLLLCLLVFYLGIIFNNDYHKKPLYGVLCGAFGAFAYFTKSYAFPFFLVHFTTMNIAHAVRCETKKNREKVLMNVLLGLVTFFLIISPWVYSISSKYGHFTISNMGKGNFAAHAPGMPLSGYEVGGPMFHKGFFPPPNETAMSAWEDPSYIWEDIKSWNPLDSFDSFLYFVKLVGKNIFECINYFESFSRLSIAIIIAYILIFLVKPFSKKVLRADLLYVLFTLTLFTGGYLPFHFELRYLWLPNILLLLMGGYVTNMLLKHDFFSSNMRKNFLIVIFALSFILTPLKSFVSAGKNNINKDMHEISMLLKEKFSLQGNIASNREWKYVPVHDSWHKTFRLSYWLNSKYYGQAKLGISDEELEAEFEKYNMDYYFYWGKSDDLPELLSRYRELTGGQIEGLKIFSLKDRIDVHEKNALLPAKDDQTSE